MKNSLSKVGVYLGIFILALTVPFSVYLATQTTRPTSLSSHAGLTGSSLLYLWPASLEVSNCPATTSLPSCPKAKIQVILNTKGAVSGGTDIVIKYDPRILRVVDNKISPGSVDESFNQIMQVFDYYRDGEVDNRSGIIKIKSSGSFNGEKGVVATFFVNGLSAGESRLEFLAGQQFVDGSKVWDEKELNNILGGVEGATVTVK